MVFRVNVFYFPTNYFCILSLYTTEFHFQFAFFLTCISLPPSLSPLPPTPLVADTVIVTSKHNEDKQYIWESDASQFSIVEDPRGDTLLRGTTVSLVMKEEAMEFLEPQKLRGLVEKYSQFINFPIYIWESKVETFSPPPSFTLPPPLYLLFPLPPPLSPPPLSSISPSISIHN